MFKSATLILTFALSLNAYSAAEPLDCQTSSSFEQNLADIDEATSKSVGDDCPKPTENQIIRVCNSIYGQKPAENTNHFGYKYEEDLFQMSCANPDKDSMDVSHQKIRSMWSQNKEKFICSGYNGTSQNGNVMKFSMDVGFPPFIVSLVKKYKVDVNFKDPADGLTILDFVVEQRDKYKQSGYVEKTAEYERIYNILLKAGAKQSKDL